MNKLAGGAGCGFKVSNKQDPCTVGVDLASNTVSLKAFCAVEGSAPPPPRYVPPLEASGCAASVELASASASVWLFG
jgi:hypothetical protein